MEMTFDNYTLRLVRADDLEDYFDLIERNRPRLLDFFAGTVAVTKTIEDTKQHLADVISNTEKNNYFSFVLIDNMSGKLVGSMQIKSIDWTIPKAELGYYIDAEYEGKKLVTRAISILVDFGFNELKLNKLFIRTAEENAASRAIAEKNGFILEGIITADYKTTSGRIVDTMYFGRLSPAFKR